MIIPDIETALKLQGVVEIDYVNQEGKHSVLHISHIEEVIGTNNIMAYCYESQSNLTFKKNRILRMKWTWKFIYNEEDVAPQKGLYVFACRSDMHIDTFCCQLEKGEKLVNVNKYTSDKPLAIHYVDSYDKSSSSWKLFNGDCQYLINLHHKIDWFNLLALNGTVESNFISMDFPYFLKNKKINLSETYDGLEITTFNSNGVLRMDYDISNVLAIHTFPSFTEREHHLFNITYLKCIKDNQEK